jgi:very-short-patch-repair endonuclease
MKINSLDLKERATIYEKIVFRSLPKILKNNAVTQKPFKINGRKYFADIYIKKINTVIEIDGDYHKDRVSIDKLRDEDFLSIGIRTIRIPNSDVKDGSFIKKIKEICSQCQEK